MIFLCSTEKRKTTTCEFEATWDCVSLFHLEISKCVLPFGEWGGHPTLPWPSPLWRPVSQRRISGARWCRRITQVRWVSLLSPLRHYDWPQCSMSPQHTHTHTHTHRVAIRVRVKMPHPSLPHRAALLAALCPRKWARETRETSIRPLCSFFSLHGRICPSIRICFLLTF